MIPFLLSGIIGFLIYQALAWAHVPRGQLRFRVGGTHVWMSRNGAAWARRVLRFVITVLILFIPFLFHPKFVSPASIPVQAAVILGFFWGPLFAIWINAVLANSAGGNLSNGQFIAGIGLALLFLIGSFGNETSEFIKHYSRKISNVKIAGAELSFSDKAAGRISGSPGAGSIPPPGQSRVLGSVGLGSLAGLDETIARDIKYLDRFKSVELDSLEKQLNGVMTGDRQRQALRAKIRAIGPLADKTRQSLETAQSFATQTVTTQLNCLGAWYEATADSASINRHLTTYGDLFRRLQAYEAKEQIDDISAGIVRVSAAIAFDVANSVPTTLIGNQCDALFKQLCPDEVPAKHDLLRRCLQTWVAATTETTTAPRKQPKPVADRLTKIRRFVQSFIDSKGVKERPYFVVGYASILAQLGQYTAAGAVLDGWLQEESNRPTGERWDVAESWFELRARATLAAYMEEWIRSEGPQPPTRRLDVHLQNMELSLSYLDNRLRAAPFFAKIKGDLDNRKDPDFKAPGECEIKSDLDPWRKLFETYVTLKLTFLQDRLLHVRYRDAFAKYTTRDAQDLVNTDLSCIPDRDRALIYQAQILEAFARNALMYNDVRSKLDRDEIKKKRLSDAHDAAERGRNILEDALNRERLENLKRSSRTGAESSANYLKRIDPSDAEDTSQQLVLLLDTIARLQEDEKNRQDQ